MTDGDHQMGRSAKGVTSVLRNLSIRPWLLAAAALVAVSGCGSIPVQENPTTVVSSDYDAVWEATIRVLEDYFEIAQENRYFGQIETKPLASATLFEPWRGDAVDFSERLEASMQTIRRRGYVWIQPAPTGGYIITVEVYKELEDLIKPAYSTFAGGTFIPSIEPIRESVVSTGVPPTKGWISLGRDLKLEAKIIHDLHSAVDGHTAAKCTIGTGP